MPHPSQDELRQEVERLRIEVELAAKGIKIEEGDVEVDMMMPPEAILKGFTSPEDFTIKETTMDYGDGSSYQGEMLGVLRHGSGTFIQKDGTKYTGQWSYNLLEGRGTAITRSGQTYEGEFRKGRAHGRGKALYENGACYQGDWEADGRHGWGHQLFPQNEGSYEGEWSNDKIHGRGRWTYADGSFFEGEWIQGERTQGRFVSADGQEEYSGQWKNDRRHGHGVQYRAGICKYEGAWENDLQHGQGRCDWVDGSLYDGEWKQGKRSGQGKYTTTTSTAIGMKYEGEWEDDMPHGQGICIEDNGDKYMGAFIKGKRHGFGRCLYAIDNHTSGGGGGGGSNSSNKNRTKYEGEWKEGKRWGHGTCAYANGEVYIGAWERDHRHGHGVCRFSDGSKFQGEWEDDGWVQSGADPAQCYVAGAGVTRGTAGKKAVFAILARDEDGNQRLCGGEEFSVQLVLHPDEDEKEEERIGVDEPPNGSSGVSNAVEADNEADRPAGAAGTTALTTTQQRPLKVRQIVSVTGEVKDCDDGTYEVSYIATTAGIYELNITLDGTEHVADSPYPVRIVPAKPYARNTRVRGPGRSQAVAGTATHFKIILFDKYGNQCVSSNPYSEISVPLEAYLEGAGAGPMNANKLPIAIMSSPEAAAANLFDTLGIKVNDVAQEGALVGCYTAPELPGYYRLHVEWDGAALPGTPYSVHVKEKRKEQVPNTVDKNRDAPEPLFEADSDSTAELEDEATATKATAIIRDEMAAWERIAAAAYAVDGVTEGWDSEDDEAKKKETSEDAYINAHPDVPVVENLEDLWLVSKLQKERKAKEEEQKRKKLESVREKLEGKFGPGQIPTAEEAEVALKEILKEEKLKEEKEKQMRDEAPSTKLARVDDSFGDAGVECAEKQTAKSQDRMSRAELLAAAAALDAIC